MMKTTLIKDLYGEIDRLKAEVHAAREKSGVYIPRDRFYQDEAEKKAMAEKVERIEDELESNRKLLDEMQEKYDLEHELCKEICTQLELKQTELEETKQTLTEAKDHIRQANDKIDEKDFIISNQQQSEAVLLEKTIFLHSNLEQTVQDVTGLFAKIERKERIEAGNIKLVQTFQSDLTHRLETIRRAVSTSVKQQQEQLVSFEEQLQAFMSSKLTSAEELKRKVEDLKLLYFSRLQGLHELAQSHERSADSTLDRISCANSDHTVVLQDLLRDAVLEAELVLRDLESTLLNQQKELASFAQQQREGAHSSMQKSKEISRATLDSLDQLGAQATELSRCIDESSLAQEHSLEEFERTFEVQAREEEQQMLQDICEILSKAKARKSALVHATVLTLREQATMERRLLQDGMKRVGDLACETQSQWESYTKQTEDYNIESSAQTAAKHCQIEALIQNCVKRSHDASQQWKNAQCSVEQCTKSHIPVIESIIREAKEINANLRIKSEKESNAAQAEVEAVNTGLLMHMQDNVKFENEAKSGFQSSIASQLQTIANLRSCHHTKVEEMQRYSAHLFQGNYEEDRPTTTTPQRRRIDVPNKTSIEKLCAPPAEILVKKYRERVGFSKEDSAITEQENITTTDFTSKPLPSNQTPITRIPLARLN